MPRQQSIGDLALKFSEPEGIRGANRFERRVYFIELIAAAGQSHFQLSDPPRGRLM